MTRSILDIAKEAMDRDNTGPQPTTLFGTNNRDARILRVAAKDVMRDIMRNTEWRGLSELTSTWVLALQPGVFAYPLPPDFLRLIPNTEFRNGWPMGLIGPATPQVWSHWLHGGGVTPTSMGWRIKNNAIFIHPTPDSAELVTLEYISKYLVVATVETGDYDGEMPPNPVDGVVPRDGHIEGDASQILYEATGSEFAYEVDPGYDAAEWATELYEILQRINPFSLVAPLPQVRREEITADTDMVALADDYLLSIGLTWRYRSALGKEHTQLKADYYAELEMKLGTDAGGARNIPLGRDRIEVGCVPLGNGDWMIS